MWLVVGAVVLLAAGGVAVGLLLTSSNGPKKTTVSGTFELTDADSAANQCQGTGGYSDISAGTTVILTNQDGKILGSSALGTGTSAGAVCTYSFTIPKVPENQQQYAVEVSHRGKVVNSQADMKANGWTFSLTLGQ